MQHAGPPPSPSWKSSQLRVRKECRTPRKLGDPGHVLCIPVSTRGRLWCQLCQAPAQATPVPGLSIMFAGEADMEMYFQGGDSGNEHTRATGQCWGSGAQGRHPGGGSAEQQVEELSLGVAGISERSQCLPALPAQAQTHATTPHTTALSRSPWHAPPHLPSQGRGGRV